MRALNMLFAGAVVMAAGAAQGALVYDNFTTPAIGGYAEVNTNLPSYGDQLNLTQGGALTTFGLSLFNPTATGSGPILTGTMLVNFYDNTVPYGGGLITNALLGTAVLNFDATVLGPTGLAPGFFTLATFDLTTLNINLTPNILVTQRFTQLTGTSTRNGVVLLNNPVVGSSPTNVYISSTATAPNLYSFGGTAASSQFAYRVNVTPAPAAAGLLGLGGLVAARRRRA